MIEIMAVLVILGIILGITVVGYSSWQRRAAEDQVRSELHAALNGYRNYKNFNGSYAVNVETVMGQRSGNVELEVFNNAYVYCIVARSKKFTDIRYIVSSSDSEIQKVDSNESSHELCPN